MPRSLSVWWRTLSCRSCKMASLFGAVMDTFVQEVSPFWKDGWISRQCCIQTLQTPRVHQKWPSHQQVARGLQKCWQYVLFLCHTCFQPVLLSQGEVGRLFQRPSDYGIPEYRPRSGGFPRMNFDLWCRTREWTNHLKNKVEINVPQL